MSDSDSDFEILAVSNSDGVFIDDKELLNNEFKNLKVLKQHLSRPHFRANCNVTR